jgi:hypothetical protein
MGAVALTLVLTIPNAPPTGYQHDEHVNSHPLLVPVTSASVLLAFISYNKSGVGAFGNFIFLGSSFVGLFGLWVVRVFNDFISQVCAHDLGSPASFCGAICNLEKDWS